MQVGGVYLAKKATKHYCSSRVQAMLSYAGGAHMLIYAGNVHLVFGVLLMYTLDQRELPIAVSETLSNHCNVRGQKTEEKLEELSSVPCNTRMV
jgi:hypothetical protein